VIVSRSRRGVESLNAAVRCGLRRARVERNGTAICLEICKTGSSASRISVRSPNYSRSSTAWARSGDQGQAFLFIGGSAASRMDCRSSSDSRARVRTLQDCAAPEIPANRPAERLFRENMLTARLDYDVNET